MLQIKFAVGVLIILAQLFVYVNAEYIYGPYAAMVKNVLLVYFILLAVFSPYVIQILNRIGPQDIPNFTIGFVLTAAVMLVVPVASITGEVEKGLTLALGFGFLHGLIKAFDEEIIFRGVLPKIMGGTRAADIVSSIIFGVFHLAVSGANIFVMLLLMGLGIAWVFMRDRFGLMGSTGSHFAYNLAALKVLPKIIGG